MQEILTELALEEQALGEAQGMLQWLPNDRINPENESSNKQADSL